MSSTAASVALAPSPMPAEPTSLTAQAGEPAQLVRRTLSAVVLAPFALLFIHLGAPWFDLLVAVLAVLMGLEWARLIRGLPADSRIAWAAFGAVYIAAPCLAVLWLRAGADGRETLLWLAVTVWTTDMAAFAFGKAIGGPRLAPGISPAKTWAGFAGGLAGAVLASMAMASLLGLKSAAAGLAVGAVVGLVAQGGDLLESGLKRRFGVKDTGHLIPGHGGVLDRLDAMLTAAPFVALLVWANGGRLP